MTLLNSSKKIFSILSLMATQVFAATPWVNPKTLAVNKVTGVVATSEINCFEGSRPNGLNFPTFAAISIPIEKLKTTNSKGQKIKALIGSHVKIVSSSAHNIYECSNLPAEILAAGEIEFNVTQIFHEVYQRRGDGKCQKHNMEDITLHIAGYKMSGRFDMRAFPIDLSNCN